MPHNKPNCHPSHLTFGGHCLNCGANAPKIKKPSKAERRENLQRLGFEFPKSPK